MRTRLQIPLFSASWAAVGMAAALVLFSPAGAVAQIGSVYDDGMFELGDSQAPPGFPGMADILLDGALTGPDWEDIFDADGSWRDDYPLDEFGNPVGNGIPDFQELHGGWWAVFTADDISLGSGFEGTALNWDGRIVNAVADADHDIGNAYVYWTTDLAGNMVLFAGAERLGAGDSQLQLEFNQEHFRLGHGGYGVGEPWEVLGSRVVGDAMIQLTFSEGALGAVSVSSWNGDSWVSLGGTIGEGCNVAETVCAVCNASTVDGGPWPNYDTADEPEQISSQRFVEVGANVGALLGSSLSYTTVRLRTPQDAAFGYFAEGN